MMHISSRVFFDGKTIPVEYTCDGEGINPPLYIENIPEGAKTLILTCEDIDSVKGVWDHWVLFNIPVQSEEFYIEENSIPEGEQGAGTHGTTNYFPPCPQQGTHRYVFTVYALSAGIDLHSGVSKEEIMNHAQPYIMTSAQCTGLYGRV